MEVAVLVCSVGGCLEDGARVVWDDDNCFLLGLVDLDDEECLGVCDGLLEADADAS